MGRRRNEQAEYLVRRGNRKRLRHLLGKHESLRNSDEAMLVYTAIWFNKGMLRWLLEHDVSPDSRKGNTPLMQAAADGDIVTMRLLLEFGANPNALNEESENPLGFATTYEQPDAIKLLVDAGADINNQDDSGPGRTQLDCAELSGWTDCVDVLRSLGAKRHSELNTNEG